MTRIGWSAHSANSFARVAVATWVSLSKLVAHSGCAIWQGWWAMSPVITALCPSDWIITLTWPGARLGVGVRRTSGAAIFLILPPKVPIAVRTGSRKTAERSAVMTVFSSSWRSALTHAHE